MKEYGCSCRESTHQTKLVAITGGPGAGKTAVLEIAKREFCSHVGTLPEAASIVYKGGFIRKPTSIGIKAVQRAIFHVQTELEWLVIEEKKWALALCDRGTVDGLAYWPEDEATYWKELKTTKEKEFQKYALVIHLRTPPKELGYNHDNPVRIETPEEALILDQKIEKVWSGHPSRVFVESTRDFLEKTEKVMHCIQKILPICCQKK